MEMGFRCTCSRYRAGSAACSFCGGSPPPSPEGEPHDWPAVGRLFGGAWGFRRVLRLAIVALFGALVGLFALGGVLMGAVAGALAGRASNRGLLRGALLGAIAGAVLSLEFLEASCAYWCQEQTGVRGTSSMADFIEELLRGRFVEDQFEPAMLTPYHWQVDDDSRRFIEIRDVYDELVSRGLSQDALKRLPSQVIMEDMKTMQSICCAICLQNIEVGETVRSLPHCHHMFHLTCVDKWLVRCGSCPVCRQHVKCKAPRIL
ncbi:NEP1-interacting protein-like 2 isoform X1 [Syzygium oleosum]|uniref:NEP1-interacting protein-like 2 isoform X1 n=1 Tax=Syzygium oleosum TaxID=219896 RepID=UPI0011D1C377|nr:NEP1-interacting protein-like 2 isoform X1 [Syzygium oleosum]